MTVWLAVGATALGCYLVKLLGLSVPAAVLERPLVRNLAVLVPIALLAALIGIQVFGAGQALTLDARAAGIAAAVVALVARAPFLLVVGSAVAATALVRTLGG